MSSTPTADSSSPLASATVSPPCNARFADVRGKLFQSVLELLEDHDVPYCILHGNQGYPLQVASDVDCVMPATVLPQRLAVLLGSNQDRVGASLVQWIQHESTAHYFVLATAAGLRWEFLSVDVSSDYRRDGRQFYRGEDILASRRLRGGIWVPAPAIEFGCYLVKKVAKGALQDVHAHRLTQLYREDPTGCDRELGRFWRGDGVELIAAAARSGEWRAVRGRLVALRRELLWAGTVREAWSCARYWTADTVRRLRRWREPTGVQVVVLGADGSGKSTTVSALAAALAPPFRRVACNHLGPALFRTTRAGRVVSTPHSRPPRSVLGSLAKAAYWMLDYSLGHYIKTRPALARSTLVIFDRYLLDAVVDPRRYRYAGPRWVLRLIWWLVPKPDLVILLDAPPDVLRARKQEVSSWETERQRCAYLKLIATLRTGRVVDAAQSIDHVVAAAAGSILQYMTSRTLRRLEDRPRVGRPA